MFQLFSFVAVHLFVCSSFAKFRKNAIFSKTKHFRAIVSIDDHPTWAFQRTNYWTPKIQDGGDPPSWKLSNRYISTKKSSDFDDILYTTAHLEFDDSHMTKYEFLKIQDGGRPKF